MGIILSENKNVKRRRLEAEVKDGVRQVGTQLSLLSHRMSVALGLRATDLDLLNLVHRDGPATPTALAHHAGQHPATVTGVLDRLERGGWITRQRDPEDRRATLVHARSERNRELFALLAGMNTALTDVLAEYDEADLALLGGFLRRLADTTRGAAADLVTD